MYIYIYMLFSVGLQRFRFTDYHKSDGCGFTRFSFLYIYDTTMYSKWWWWWWHCCAVICLIWWWWSSKRAFIILYVVIVVLLLYVHMRSIYAANLHVSNLDKIKLCSTSACNLYTNWECMARHKTNYFAFKNVLKIAFIQVGSAF